MVAALTVTTNAVNGRSRRGIGYVENEPPVAEPPSRLQAGYSYVKAFAYTAPTVIDARNVVPDRVWAEAPADRTRIIVGGKDVTYFRDVPTPLPGYRLTQPHGYGSTRLVFPQTHAAYERYGEGPLRWLKKERPVRFQRVDPETGAVAGRDYFGVIEAVDTELVGGRLVWAADVGGELSGRASMRDQQPPIFRTLRDVQLHVQRVVRGLNLLYTVSPATGVRIYAQGGMSQLDWLNTLCANAVKRDGTQYTLMPVDGKPRTFEFREKDTTTIHATVYFDGGNVVPELRDDLRERPNKVYMTGVTPEGMYVKNGAYPGLRQSKSTPAYPFADNRTFGVGDDLTGIVDGSMRAIHFRLAAAKYLDLNADVLLAEFTDTTAEALEELQEDAGLPETGDMDPDTWAALWDLSVTGFSLRQSTILPMSQAGYVREWLRTSSGARLAKNPAYNPTRLEVHRTIDAGHGHEKRTLRRFARLERKRALGKNWVGTARVNTGAVIRGEHTPGTPITAADVMPLAELRPGMNVLAPLFDGGTLFHVPGIEVDAGGKTGTLTLDTKARDMMTVAEIVNRNRESRRDPARAWMKAQRKSTTIRDGIVPFDEIGGEIYETVACPANEWTIIPIVAGESGWIRKLRVETTDALATFALSLWGLEPRKDILDSVAATPLVMDEDGEVVWDKGLDLFKRKLLLYSMGTEEEPGGYSPRRHTNLNGDPTDAAITGVWEDEAGVDYYTTGAPVLYLAIWPTVATTLAPQRVFWPQLGEA